MTLTLAAVYTPIGFLGGVTGTLFREFAFTLAGAVIISGIVAVTLSPMMCSLLLHPAAAESRFARLIDRGFSRLADAYGRRLQRSLDYRPVTALFAAAIIAALVFMYLNTKKELAPEEDQGVLFALTKAPQYANLDYLDAYGDELDKAFTSIPEARAALRRQRQVRTEPGHRRDHPEAVGRTLAQRPADQADPAEEGQCGRGASTPLSSRCRRCRPRSAGCRCRW